MRLWLVFAIFTVVFLTFYLVEGKHHRKDKESDIKRKWSSFLRSLEKSFSRKDKENEVNSFYDTCLFSFFKFYEELCRDRF